MIGKCFRIPKVKTIIMLILLLSMGLIRETKYRIKRIFYGEKVKETPSKKDLFKTSSQTLTNNLSFKPKTCSRTKKTLVDTTAEVLTFQTMD